MTSKVYYRIYIGLFPEPDESILHSRFLFQFKFILRQGLLNDPFPQDFQTMRATCSVLISCLTWITLICSEALNTVRQEAQIIQRPQNLIPGLKFKEVR